MPSPRPAAPRKTATRKRTTVAAKRRTVAPAAVLKPAMLQPRFKAMAAIRLSRRRKAEIPALKIANRAQARQSMAAMKLRRNEIAGVMDEVTMRHAQARHIHAARGIMANWQKTEDMLGESFELVNWARGGDAKRRRMLSKAFSQEGKGTLLIHNIGGMERKDARAFMKEFLAAGGSVADAAEWLSEAGRFLREKSRGKPGTDGWLSDAWNAVSGAVGSVVDWATAAINTVADALQAAGKHLGRAIKEAAKWGLSKVTDFVDGLIRAGKSVATILTEALRNAAAEIGKFVKALLRAGRAIREVLKWAAAQAINTVKNVVAAMIAAGKAIRTILVDAVKEAGSVVLKTVQALFRLGKKLLDIVKSAVGMTFVAVFKLTDALLKAGQSLANILHAVATGAISAIAHVVKALVDLGKSLGAILFDAVNRITFGAFKKIVDGLLRAGKKIIDVISAGVGRGWRLLAKAVRAMVSLGRKVADILGDAFRKGRAAVRWVIQGIKDAGKKIKAVLDVVVDYVGKRLKLAVMGLHEVFRDPVGVIKRFVRSRLNTIRMVLDGLLGAGLSFFRAVKEIVKNVGNEFRKGFFKGLVALGHGVVDIMTAALKLTGALAGLALATILDVLGGHRDMTAAEKREARRIFGSSIDLGRVKIAAASIPSDLIMLVNGQRPFTTMYVLNFPSWREVKMGTLIHELAHTWQGTVAGPVYMVEAIHAQMKAEIDDTSAYTYTDAELAGNGGDFSRFNREQQASIVEDYYLYKFGNLKNRTDAATIAAKLRPYARAVFRPLAGSVRFNRLVPSAVAGIRPVAFIPAVS